LHIVVLPAKIFLCGCLGNQLHESDRKEEL